MLFTCDYVKQLQRFLVSRLYASYFSREGLAIVKVFAIHDPSLPLAPHKETLESKSVAVRTQPSAVFIGYLICLIFVSSRDPAGFV